MDESFAMEMSLKKSPAVTLDSVFHDAARQLEDAGVDQPKLDARILICHALGIERSEMTTLAARGLTEIEAADIRALIGRRCRREPVGRILGTREFWSLPFGLNEATLEPRPDSETLVEVVLKDLGDRSEVSICDVGTGTGCLLLALLHELPQATGTGVDVNPHAVDQARDNAENLGLQSRAMFRISNWLDNIVADRFDIIVSNPPYIVSRDIPTLMPEVRNYDPLVALDGGEDGLTAYRLLIPQLRERLKPGGTVVFEVGLGQAVGVGELLTQNGFTNVTTHMDLGGVERCVKANIP
jgi:release factor glutamine methyltransferase